MTCPRCGSHLVQAPNDDGDWDCIDCGERWPAITHEDRLRQCHEQAVAGGFYGAGSRPGRKRKEQRA